MVGVGRPSGSNDTWPLHTSDWSSFMNDINLPASFVPRASNPFSGVLKSRSTPCIKTPIDEMNSIKHNDPARKIRGKRAMIRAYAMMAGLTPFRASANTAAASSRPLDSSFPSSGPSLSLSLSWLVIRGLWIERVHTQHDYLHSISLRTENTKASSPWPCTYISGESPLARAPCMTLRMYFPYCT